MLQKTDNEKITALLKATICLLCKNGIAFKEKFTIDAVIGVTVDDSDVILVSMNELVHAATSAVSPEKKSSPEDSDDQQALERVGRKRRRCSYKNETERDPDLNIDVSDSAEGTESEIVPSNGDSQSSADLVFIKQEMMEENWPEMDNSTHCSEEMLGLPEHGLEASSGFDGNLLLASSQQRQSWLSVDYGSGMAQPIVVTMKTNSRLCSPDSSNKTLQRGQQYHQSERQQRHQVSFLVAYLGLKCQCFRIR